jgi:hypothetical protein
VVACKFRSGSCSAEPVLTVDESLAVALMSNTQAAELLSFAVPQQAVRFALPRVASSIALAVQIRHSGIVADRIVADCSPILQLGVLGYSELL